MWIRYDQSALDGLVVRIQHADRDTVAVRHFDRFDDLEPLERRQRAVDKRRGFGGLVCLCPGPDLDPIGPDLQGRQRVRPVRSGNRTVDDRRQRVGGTQ